MSYFIQTIVNINENKQNFPVSIDEYPLGKCVNPAR